MPWAKGSTGPTATTEDVDRGPPTCRDKAVTANRREALLRADDTEAVGKHWGVCRYRSKTDLYFRIAPT